MGDDWPSKSIDGAWFEARFDNPVKPCTRLDVLVNGDRIFPAMLQAIATAVDEICFETYAYWQGDIAQHFAAALSSAAGRGVSVKVVLDWWGAKPMAQSLLEQMRNAGVCVCFFNPLRWWQLRRSNYRTHRKILVVDRSVAFIGGVGIAEEWCGDAGSPQEWHDLHYRLFGPIVGEIHEAFRRLWSEQTGHNLPATIPYRHPDVPQQCGFPCQVLTSSPRRGSEATYRLFRHAIESAAESIDIVTAYFVPDQDSISALVAALRRGVSLRIMVPGPHIDFTVVRHTARSSWGELLAAGACIYIYQPTMLHAKVTVVDAHWLIIGSANFDNRSFSLNDEIVMNVISESIALEHRTIFEADRQRCRRLTYEAWQSRGWLARGKEFISNLVRGQL